MTEHKYTMESKEDLGNSKKGLFKNKTEDRKKSKKLKQLMKKRIIVRNLSFKVSEEQLKQIFSEFGEVLEVDIPVNEAGRKRGFAFVQFKDSKSQLKAMKAMNFKEICGRRVALDFAVHKITYQSQQKTNNSTSELSEKSKLNESDSGSDKEDVDTKDEHAVQEELSDHENDEDSKVTQFLKEFNPDNESEGGFNSEASDESSSSDSEDNESHFAAGNDESQTKKRKHSEDVSEGKTVFIRNVSYKNTEEDLQEVMQEYGETEYCLLCMDPFTDHPKGTAFVKFKEKGSAEKLVEESAKEPGIILDGRRLACVYAVSRNELLKKNSDSGEFKDKRNLRLLKCSLIMYGSEESGGVSQTDMAKRAQLEMIKKKKLKNVNFFVSDKRLAVHNLPKNITDQDRRNLFKKAAGKGAIIKERKKKKSKVSNLQNKKMKNENKVNNPLSPEMLDKKRKKNKKNVPKNKKKKRNMNIQEKKFVSALTDKYKKKLQDKVF